MSEAKAELTIVRAAIETAAPEPAVAAVNMITALASARYNSSGLPEDSHIIALGTEGKRRHYIDARGQLVSLEVREHNRVNVLGLLGPCAKDAATIWPLFKGEGKTPGFDHEAALRDLLTASGQRFWAPRDRVHGRGFWLDAHRNLIVHTGTQLFHQGQWISAGCMIDNQVYPASEDLMMPVAADPYTPFAAGRQTLQWLETRWNWKRNVDGRLALGIWAALLAGGALTWRPVVSINGDTHAGKSLLCQLFDALGGGFILLTEDATEAGLRQSLGHDAVGLIVDENEPDNTGRAAAINRMARRSSSGGRARRGTAGAQTAIEFTLRSTVASAAIHRVGFLEQDINRRLTLELAKPPSMMRPVDPREARTQGAQLLHLLIDGWPRLQPAIEMFHAVLIEKGHQDRQALVYAQVLGLADILTTAEPVDHDHAEELVQELGVTDLPDAALTLSDPHAWLHHFGATLLPLDSSPGTARRPIAEWLALASRLSQYDAFYDNADKVLRHHGIVIVRPKSKAEPITEFWVAARHPLLERIHAGSRWEAADGVGRWSTAAQKLPGAHGSPYRLFGPTLWGTKVALELIIDDGIAEAAVDEITRQSSFADELEPGDR